MGFVEFYTPTEVYFGKDAESLVGEKLAAAGYKKVLIHFGSGSVKKTGLLDRVEKNLKDAGLEFVELGGLTEKNTATK